MAKLTDSEWKVLNALWAGGPQHLAQGLVSADEHSPRHSAAVTLEECAAQEERSLMDRAYGGSAGKLAAAFLRSASLTREERDELRKLLDEMEV